MNPNQLWDTTMNPENRMLIKVTESDAITSNNIFSALMGDNVEVRKEFIQKMILIEYFRPFNKTSRSIVTKLGN